VCSYVIFTAVVVLSERVEATVQKGFFRFLGTVIGGRQPLHATIMNSFMKTAQRTFALQPCAPTYVAKDCGLAGCGLAAGPL
jgi:Aluminium activated malate transporter